MQQGMLPTLGKETWQKANSRAGGKWQDQLCNKYLHASIQDYMHIASCGKERPCMQIRGMHNLGLG